MEMQMQTPFRHHEAAAEAQLSAAWDAAMSHGNAYTLVPADAGDGTRKDQPISTALFNTFCACHAMAVVEAIQAAEQSDFGRCAELMLKLSDTLRAEYAEGNADAVLSDEVRAQRQAVLKREATMRAAYWANARAADAARGVA